MALYKELIDLLTELSFKSFREMNDHENKYNFSDFDIFYKSEAMIVAKNFDNWLSLKDSWYSDQINVLQLIKNNPKFSAKTYFFLCIEGFDVREYEKLDVHIIERDERICKKYVISNNLDFSRIPLLNVIDFSLELNEPYETKFRKKLLKIIEKCESDVIDEVHRKIENYFIEQKEGDELHEN